MISFLCFYRKPRCQSSVLCNHVFYNFTNDMLIETKSQVIKILA
jgi:hypothetical protein